MSNKQFEEDTQLIKKLTEVIEDFMPNIGRCVLQRYDQLNESLIASKVRLAQQLPKASAREIFTDITNVVDDPTHDMEAIEADFTWRIAFILSEMMNDRSPIGWGKYIPVAIELQDKYTMMQKPFKKANLRYNKD